MSADYDHLDETLSDRLRRFPVRSGKRKKIDKPWRVCWRWRPRIVRPGDSLAQAILGGDRSMSHPFATREEAERYMEKQIRSFASHPSSGQPWGPDAYWIEGPTDAEPTPAP